MTASISPEERQKYMAYYSGLLKKRLGWALNHVRENRQPIAIQEHMQTWLQILRESHRPELHADAAALISLLHPWPLHWGYWADWEKELSFAIENADTLQTPEDKAEFLTNLANLMFLTGRRDDALALGKQAFSFARLAHAVVPLTKSGVMVASILQDLKEEQAAADILDLIEQEIAEQAAQGKNEIQIATAQASFVSHQARRLFRTGREDEALNLINNTIDRLERLPGMDPNVLADSYNMRSGFYWAQSKYSLSIEDLNRAIALVSAAGYGFAESAFRGNLGVCYWTIGELKLAEETLRRCIRQAEKSQIYFRLAYDVGNLALVFLSQGRVQDALVMSERHIALAKNRSSPAENMRASDNYGVIQVHAGNLESAEIALKQNIPAYEKKSLKADIIILLTNLARCYAALGETEKAMHAAEKAFEHAQQQDYSAPTIVALRCLAEFRPPYENKPLLDQALTLARQCNRPLDEAACLLSLASIEKNRSEQKKLWEEGAQILNKIGASAWLEGCSVKRPPKIALMC
jgi:tetratricopeptide (TPR) repeat protein